MVPRGTPHPGAAKCANKWRQLIKYLTDKRRARPKEHPPLELELARSLTSRAGFQFNTGKSGQVPTRERAQVAVERTVCDSVPIFPTYDGLTSFHDLKSPTDTKPGCSTSISIL